MERRKAVDRRKHSVYFPEDMVDDIAGEAERLERSFAWVVQRCVKIGLPEIRKYPSIGETGRGDSGPTGGGDSPPPRGRGRSA